MSTARGSLRHLIRARLEALVTDLSETRQGNREALHRTRVASRRMREVLPFLLEDIPPAKLRKARSKTRRITSTLGGVRELDVALAMLTDIEAARPGLAPALRLVRDRIARERQALHVRMIRRLAKLDPEALVSRLWGRIAEGDTDGSGAWQRLLARQLERRADRLRRAVRHSGALYAPERLHQVRVALKKLRYLLELAHDSRLMRSAAPVRTLKRTQDTLGHLHDLEVLVLLIRDVQAREDARHPAVRELDAVVADLTSEGRRLHGRYLRQQESVLGICDLAAREIAPRVRASKPAPARPTTRRIPT